ncbi:MAG: exodeoxyribonuclease V subunit gamma, partial [Gammaproteobacteria bacterium]|nr:exodeoxyribonuclease V subunit gamma [Gammaproteobacteria bacterium]
MLQFFQSNDLSALTNAFCQRSQLNDTDPFTPSTVIVQSYGTGQWLKLQLAASQGISANLDCVLPAHFIWGLYRNLLDQPKQSPMDKDLLTWRLMSILPGQGSPEFEGIRSYLSIPGDRDLRTFQLASKIAGLFDQYLVYRPEWLLAWEEDKDPIASNPHRWQPLLWRTLMQENPELKEQHRARLHQRLLKRLEKLDEPDLLPQHLSLFGLSSLPLIQLDTFRALSAHIDVDIYFMNPCRHYWGDIVSEKDMAKRSIRELIGKTEPLEEEDYLEVGNPLLASMGKQGREFLELILETDRVNSFDAFVETSVDTALGFLQNDILNLEFGGQFGSSSITRQVKLKDDDHSIQVHSCHSKLREIEILYDQLLLIFSANPQITPADVIVMTPNVADYAPFIHSVFKKQIHYGIADRSLLQQSALVGSFCKLLELPDSRLTSVEVMDFLEVPAIARKFKLGEEELNTISYWINGAGIRWEIDGRVKSKRWQVPDNPQNTWRFGLDRLLLGMAMDSSNGIFEGDFPFDLESGDPKLLGTLCLIVQLIDDFRQLLAAPKTASAWQAAINAVLAELFIPLDEEALDLSMIQTLMQKLVDDTQTCGYEGDLSGQLVRYWINQQLAVIQSSMGFISGGITFATLIPMRSIPFKVVGLLGMNDLEYPREDRPVSFD